MSFLGLGLVAEGPSDYRFFPAVLYRLAEDLCLQHGRTPVEIGAVVPLELSGLHGTKTERIVQAAMQAAGSYHVLFLHTDGNGDHDAAIRDRVGPWKAALSVLGSPDDRTVAVVPVREMEAWAFCDGGALRAAFGTTLTDTELGVPRKASDVEGIVDPKAALQAAYERVFRPKRPRRSSVEMLEVIAERVSLDRLRQLPAFRRLEADLAAAMRDLHYIV